MERKLNKTLSEREKEWKEVEDLVIQYQKQFADEKYREESNSAGNELLTRFTPLIRKYYTLITTGQINFNDKEMKVFISAFLDQQDLRRALFRKKQSQEYKSRIYQNFNFIKEIYGSIDEEEILMDLQMLLLVLAKRYKIMGKSYCGYVYNSYCFEVARHIKSYISDMSNIPYRKLRYEDSLNGMESTECDLDDALYEDVLGIPDYTWISGTNCSDIFSNLSNLDRKIVVKYYLESYTDKQIAKEFSVHMNTINQKRKAAVKKIAVNYGVELDNIKRSRNSGKRAVTAMR